MKCDMVGVGSRLCCVMIDRLKCGMFLFSLVVWILSGVIIVVSGCVK